MNDRQQLRQQGQALQQELFGPGVTVSEHGGLEPLLQEFAFGSLWSRPGLGRADRMIATLSALCVRGRLSVVEKYVKAALDAGLQAPAINEIFIQCGIYAGLETASEDCLKIAAAAFRSRGIEVPSAPPRDDAMGVLAQRGAELMQALHGERKHQDYASPDNAIAATFYPYVMSFCYGEIWNRPGLLHRERAICAIASFTALTYSGLVAKFAKAGVNMGLSQQEVLEVVMQTTPYSGFAPVLQALSAISASNG